MQEQRLTLRVLKYWEVARKAADIPEYAKLNGPAMDDLWGHCFVVSVNTEDKLAAYRYIYMGRPIAELYGRDLTDLYVGHSTGSFPGKIIHYKFIDVVKGRKPVHDEGHFINENGKIVKYRACIMPLGNKKTVTHLLVAVSHGVF